MVRRDLLGLAFVAVFVAAALVFTFRPKGDRQAGDATLRIALIPMGTTDEYWRAVHAGGLTAARELGVELIWQGPIRRDDRSAQFDVVENMIVRRVSGIVLAPVDDMALRGPVEDAFRRDIPVVIIDSDLRSDRITSFIATDNYQGGVLAGEHLAKSLGGKGKIALLRGVEGNASTDHRQRGFIDAIKRHPGLELVSFNQHGGGTSESAYKASENLIAPFKTASGGIALDGIFCPNESTTFGMLRALQDGGLVGKVRLVGFDSSRKLNEALSKGEIDALVVQDPVRIGYLGVKTVVARLLGQHVEEKVAIEATVVTRLNMLQPAMARLLQPDLSILSK